MINAILTGNTILKPHYIYLLRQTFYSLVAYILTFFAEYSIEFYSLLYSIDFTET